MEIRLTSVEIKAELDNCQAQFKKVIIVASEQRSLLNLPDPTNPIQTRPEPEQFSVAISIFNMLLFRGLKHYQEKFSFDVLFLHLIHFLSHLHFLYQVALFFQVIFIFEFILISRFSIFEVVLIFEHAKKATKFEHPNYSI